MRTSCDLPLNEKAEVRDATRRPGIFAGLRGQLLQAPLESDERHDGREGHDAAHDEQHHFDGMGEIHAEILRNVHGRRPSLALRPAGCHLGRILKTRVELPERRRQLGALH